MPASEAGLCSLQRSLAAPEHRRWRRLHGLQPPLHPQQVLGWLLLILFAASAFLLMVPSVTASWWPLFYSLLTSLFLLHGAAHLVALLLDPADPELRRLKPSSLAVPEFDRTKHAHVIENGRCHLCNIRTSGPRTKHCSVCNKCVGRFDHHCKWLNHCIGGRNYAAFLVCVVSAALACLLIVLLSVAVLVFYKFDKSWLTIYYSSPFYGNKVLYEPAAYNIFNLDENVFLFLVGFVGVLAAVAAGLLLHLCIFHVYISYRGITTYEYIRNYRESTSMKNRATSTIHPKSTSSEPIFTIQSESNGINMGNGALTSSNSCPNEYGPKSIEDRPRLERTEVWRSCCRIFRRSQRQSVNLRSKHDGQNSSRESFNIARTSLDLEHNSYAKLNSMKRTNTFPLDNSVVSISERVNGQKELVVRKSCPGCRYCQLLKADPTLKEQIDAYKRKSARRKEKRRNRRPWYSKVCSSREAKRSPRRNQVRPGLSGSKSAGSLGTRSSLPALPPPPRRQLNTVSLKELNEVLTAVQQPAVRRRSRRRKKSNPMSPTLSPIHESGLSNPPTPHMAGRPRARHSWVPPASSPLVR